MSPAVATYAFLTAITVGGLLIRLPLMGDSLFGDELSTYFVVRDDFRGMLVQVAGPQEWTPPLYFAIAWLFSKLGSDPWLLRLPSLLAGVATIPLVYVLGSMTVGRRAGAVATVLVAFSPAMMFYSTEARAYALLAFLVICSTIVLLVAMQRESLGWWVLYALLLAASMYTHYASIFILIGQTAWAFAVSPGSRRRIVFSALLGALLWLPWLGQYMADARNPYVDVIGAIGPFSFEVFVDETVNWLVGDQAAVDPAPGTLAITLMASGVAIALIDLTVRSPKRVSRSTALILVLAFTPLVCETLVSIFGPRLLVPRNLIVSYPGLALAIGSLLVTRTRWVAAISVPLVLLGIVVSGVGATNEKNRRTDYAPLVRFIERNGEPGDPIVYLPFQSSGAWQALEVELEPGSPLYRAHPVLRLGVPTLEASLRIRRVGGPGQFYIVPSTKAPEVARTAVGAATNRRIFLVTIGRTVVQPGVTSPVNPRELEDFLERLPEGWTVIGSAGGPGWFGTDVYELRVPPDRAGRRG